MQPLVRTKSKSRDFSKCLRSSARWSRQTLKRPSFCVLPRQSIQLCHNGVSSIRSQTLLKSSQVLVMDIDLLVPWWHFTFTHKLTPCLKRLVVSFRIVGLGLGFRV